MKYAEMNERQKKAYRNIVHASNWLIGGLENTVSDYGEDSVEGRNAKYTLDNHELLVNELYDTAISEVYEEGSCQFGKAAEKFLRDIRFCGREWLMERCERRIRKMGY